MIAAVNPLSLHRSVGLLVMASLSMVACKGSDGPARSAPPGTHTTAPRADAGPSAGAAGAACANDDACAFGLLCTSGRCANADCHDGDPMNPPRACPGAKHCEFADRAALRKGRGRCVDAPSPLPAEGDAAVPPAPAP
jgi:hypothetical protein